MRRRFREFISGVRLVTRGFGAWASDPKAMLLGAIPALIVGALMLTILIFVFFNVDAWAAALTPSAESWPPTLTSVVRFALALSLVVGSIVLCVLTFAAITLLVGEPFYERIRARVERRLGSPPKPPEAAFWSQLFSSIRDGLVMVLLAVGTAVVVLIAGLIPVVGSVLGLTVGALLGGRTLARELTSFAGDARGMNLRDRRALIATNPWKTLGFGVAAYFTLLIPVLAIISMPAAVVGATLLVRDLNGEATRPADAGH